MLPVWLGDTIFYGPGRPEMLRRAAALRSGATVFGYWVGDPERYGFGFAIQYSTPSLRYSGRFT